MIDLEYPDRIEIALSRRDVRFALSILCECRCLDELIAVMSGCLVRDVESIEIDEKCDAFVSGLGALNRSPVPLGISFCGGTNNN